MLHLHMGHIIFGYVARYSRISAPAGAPPSGRSTQHADAERFGVQPVDQSQKQAVSLETYEIRILELVASEVAQPRTPAKSLS
jgi:hypothetical protein